jgi:hypothetical protein
MTSLTTALTPEQLAKGLCPNFFPPFSPKLSTREEGMKFDEGKLLYSLLERDLAGPVEDVVKVITHGAKKYAARNWQKVEKHRYEDALGRHLAAWRKGELQDKDSGLPHLAHAACNILFLAWLEQQKNEETPKNG